MKSILPLLVCPKCFGKLVELRRHIQCIKCKNQYLASDKIFFVKTRENIDKNWLYDLKIHAKNSIVYDYAKTIMSPVFPSSNKYIKKMLKKLPPNSIVINIGSGNTQIDKQVINLDLFPYPNVDIVCKAEQLPFKNNSVDMIINVALLEHIEKPELVIYEAYRVLKKGGCIFTLTPFIQGFHASPNDFYRWTEKGLLRLHAQFKLEKSGIIGGPTSGFLWILQEWIALTLSFNIEILYKLIFCVLMFFTFPLKYFDFFLRNYNHASNIASNIFYMGKK